MEDFIENKRKQLYEWIEGLSSKQKLIYSIIFLLVMIFIVKVIFGIFLKEEQYIVEYKKDMSGVLLKISATYPSNNSYVQVIDAADNFISLCSNPTSNKEGKIIGINSIYDNVLYKEYSNYLSKIKFKNKVKNLIEKVGKIKSNYNKLIPTDVLQYKDDFYIVEYSYAIDNELITIFLGIALDEKKGLYYIWYIE